MTKWIHIVYLSVIVILSYLLWQQSSAPQQANLLQENAQQQEETEVVAVATAKPEQATLSTSTSADTSSDTVAEQQTTEAVDSASGDTSAASTSDLHFTDAEMAEMLKNAINVEKVKERMQTEAIDQDWAYAMQDNLQLLYDKNESLHVANLDRIECRTTVCEIQFTESNAPIDFMSSFHSKMVTSPWYNESYRSVMISNSESQTQTFYIVRTTD